MHYYVYIMTNLNHSVFYTGMTSNLENRVFQHKSGVDKNSFTYRYNCDKLVYFEVYGNAKEAIFREKQLKRYKHSFKINLIQRLNPDWNDLSVDWYRPEEFELSWRLEREQRQKEKALRDSKK
ncbi:MAG: GIY-YIG nuclease family protein [Cyclobacteriaceae bacterium]|jgi:putative endonuclease